MEALKDHDREAFLELESEERKLCNMPPYGRLAALIISGKSPFDTERTARNLAKSFPHANNLHLFGPAPAPISLLRGNHRWRLLVKAEKNLKIQPILKYWLNTTPGLHKHVRVQVDIDPYGFM